MIQKKICMLGGFAVGKTSLVRRFVTNLFSEQYQSTIGVSVDKKTLSVDEQPVTLVLWDLYGEDDYQRLRESYLRGASGYVLVLDGTRRATLDTALALQETAVRVLGTVPFIAVINKADLRSEWEIDERAIGQLLARNWTVLSGSAKLGQGVDELFALLAARMLAAPSQNGS
jgi:hypothetical protein